MRFEPFSIVPSTEEFSPSQIAFLTGGEILRNVCYKSQTRCVVLNAGQEISPETQKWYSTLRYEYGSHVLIPDFVTDYEGDKLTYVCNCVSPDGRLVAEGAPVGLIKNRAVHIKKGYIYNVKVG